MIAIRLILNWFLFLTLPLWGGHLMFLREAYELANAKSFMGKALKGREWLWE